MKINIHAGHNPDGKVACGAIGLIKESTEARNVKDEVIRLLKNEGHTIYDCTVNDGTSQANVLTKIIAKCNSNTVDLDVSIHFNAGANDKTGNKKTTGTEIFLYSTSSKAAKYAEQVVKKIAGLGFTNRGIKYSTSLYVLKNSKAPAMLIECCFVDDKDDTDLYDAKKMAKAIAEGILNKTISEGTVKEETKEETKSTTETTNNNTTIYKVQTGAFKEKTNADNLVKDLKKAGYDAVVTKQS